MIASRNSESPSPIPGMLLVAFVSCGVGIAATLIVLRVITITVG